MFFCSKWSVGKVVDFAASQASLKNNNNVLTAKVTGAKKTVDPLIFHIEYTFLFPAFLYLSRVRRK